MKLHAFCDLQAAPIRSISIEACPIGGYRSTECLLSLAWTICPEVLELLQQILKATDESINLLSIRIHPYPSSIKIDHDDHVYIIIYSCIRKVIKCIWHQLQIVQMFTWRCWPFGSFASQVHCVLALLSDEEIAFRPPAQHLAADIGWQLSSETPGKTWKDKKQSTSIDSIRRNSHCLSLQ